MAETQLNRRRFLGATGALAAGFLAGCSGGDGGDPTETEPTEEPEATPTETATPTPTDTPTATTTEASSDDGTATSDDTSDDGSSDGGADGGVREIDVVMSSFKFEPGSDEPIVVSQGDTVTLCCTAADNGIGAGHGLGIPAYDVNVAPVTTEDEKCTEFTADEAGEFEMKCTIQCSQPGAGGGHKNMVGTFIVE